MERVIALYLEPYDARRPVVCLDECPIVLHADSRAALPLQPGRCLRRDYEYERRGSCCVMMAFEPLRPTAAGCGWRTAWTRPQRRAVDFARFVRHLADDEYADAERIRIVCDNLNTHGAGAFYEAFPPEEARRLAERIEFVYTPVHGSWLNVVEIELSILSRQCLARSLERLEMVASEVDAWVAYRNAIGGTVRWQMTTGEARVKLSRLYPSV